MELLARWLVAVLVLLVPQVAAAGPGGASLGFQAPAGWLDLSPSAPSESFARVSPELAAEARSKDLLFFAADVDHTGEGEFLTNVNATAISDKPSKVTKESFDELATSMGSGYVVREKSLLDFHGVSVGRITGDMSVDGAKPVTQVSYLLPSKDGVVMLMFTTTAERLAREGAIFEACARATRGLSEPSSPNLPPWALGAIIGASVTVGLGINNGRQRKKNGVVWASLEPVLRKGPATLYELMDGAGMRGFMAKGKVALCLQEMTRQQRLDVIPAPEGTPQLQKAKHIRYSLRA